MFVNFLTAGLIGLDDKCCSKCHVQGYESFVSHEGLEQLHRFIFVMAVTHVTYSCLTMLLAILKVFSSCYKFPFQLQVTPLINFSKHLQLSMLLRCTVDFHWYIF